MRLSKFTDYSFRVLMLAARYDRLTIEAAVPLCGVSEGHLKKVVRTLANAGFFKSTRGRSGGFELARDPSEINLADVVRLTETDLALVACMQASGSCPLETGCGLIGVMRDARSAFLDTFARTTLADIV